MARWVIGRLPKDKAPMMEGSVSLSPNSPPPDTPPTLQASFTLPMYTASGLKVDTLQLTNERYKPYKGVKSVTRAGKFYIRS